MKHLGSLLLISSFALLGCENTSRLDNTVQTNRADQAERGEKPSAAPAKADHSGSVEERLARLEDSQAKYAETLEWVDGIRKQQAQQAKAQQEQRQREDPDPDAVFAVDVSPNVSLGAVEGPQQALVTIVEAWDFA